MDICKIENCEKIVKCKNMCSKHDAMFRRLGYIKLRTNRCRNEIIIDEDRAYVLLYDGNLEVEKCRVIIDIDDIIKISPYKWALSSGYSYNYNNHIGMHNLIMGRKYIDHINGNKLDNRKCNLRFATLEQNNRNVGIRKNNKTGFKGVSVDNFVKKRKYNASIAGKRIGRFATLEEAAWMYDQWATQIFEDFAFLNYEYL